MRVIFLQVFSSEAKLQVIVNTATDHFEKQEKLLFITENPIAAQYIDELLWKKPLDSFIPHALINEASNELIQISTIHKNIIEAPFVFNLTSIPFLLDNRCHTVYELEDATQSTKRSLAKEKFKKYREKGLIIENK